MSSPPKSDYTDPEPTFGTDKRRQARHRTTQSCLNCHTSKRKCDRKRPCQRCVQLGLTGLCVYEIDDPALRDDPTVDENTRLRNRIAELESLVREVRGRPHPRWADSNFQESGSDNKRSRAQTSSSARDPQSDSQSGSDSLDHSLAPYITGSSRIAGKVQTGTFGVYTRQEDASRGPQSDSESGCDSLDQSSPNAGNSHAAGNMQTSGQFDAQSGGHSHDHSSRRPLIAESSDAAGNVKTGTFVIYAPPDDEPETPADSFSSNDLTSIQGTNLGIGGCLTSVHEPAQAALWMEDNWDSSLLNYIRTSGCGGPFAWMLSPTKPALANFGRYNESVVVNMAQNLAEASGFPVVIRPATDNPALTLLTRDTDSHVEYAHSNNTGGDNAERSNDREDENEDMLVDERPPGDSDNNRRGDNDLGDAEMDGQGLHAAEEYKTNQISTALGPDGGGGGGDGAGPTEVDGKWASPLHRTRVKLDLKVNAADPYAVSLGYTLKFIINRETEIPIDLNDLSRPLSQSEVIALVDLKIETRPRETQVDRSYANIGFVAHRQHSIIEREFLHRGFDLPDKVYKRGQQRQIQGGIQGAVGFSQGSPLATATFAHGRNKGTTLEATDSKVLPRCRMDYETGKEWDKDNKSFSSYNIVYQAQDIQLDGERPDFRPLEVKVGMGINLRPAGSKKPLPKLSFIHRNQVLIWVSDPALKAGIRGIMVLMSSYLDNIQTEEELSIYEQEDIDLGTGPSNAPQVKTDEHSPGTISLSIAHLQNQGVPRPKRLRPPVPSFIAKRGQQSSSMTCIPPHEYLARGWDANNNQWRSVLWPALDKDFRAADLEKTAPVWKIQCPS